jgi:PST family polysaccharide transporter/antigen flippase
MQPIVRKILFTYFSQGIILIAFFYVYRLIGIYLGPEGVGKYSLIKQVIGVLSPLLLMGLGMGLPRYIAMARNKEQRSAYIKSGWVVAVLIFIFLIGINVYKGSFVKIFFGSIKYVHLVLPFSLFLTGFMIHSIVYSYFRGRLWINTFNFFQVINLALVPLIILIFFKDITIDKLITLIGIMTFVISLVFSLFFFRELFMRVEKVQLRNSLKELFRYSIPRIPGSFILAGLFSLGPIFAVHFASIEEVGYLSVSQRLLSFAGAAIAPLGLILLPKVSSMIIQQRYSEIKENLNYLIGASIQLSVFILFQLILFADTITYHWLGSEFLDAVPVMRIVSCSIFFYLFYRTVGSILDATKVKPINTINLLISLGVFLTQSGVLLFIVKIFSIVISLSIAFVSGLICLGILSYRSIRQLYPEKLSKDLTYFFIAIGINIMIGSIAFLAKAFIVSRFYYLIIFEVLMGIIYLVILWLLKIDWLKKILEKILLRIA